MVVPIRDFGNKLLSTSAIHTSASNMTLSGDIDMAIDIVDDLFKFNHNNYNEVRDRSIASNIPSPKTLSISSSKCDEEYSARVQHESDNIVDNNQIIPSNSS